HTFGKFHEAVWYSAARRHLRGTIRAGLRRTSTAFDERFWSHVWHIPTRIPYPQPDRWRTISADAWTDHLHVPPRQREGQPRFLCGCERSRHWHRVGWCHL